MLLTVEIASVLVWRFTENQGDCVQVAEQGKGSQEPL
jgi:hypothetical protein